MSHLNDKALSQFIEEAEARGYERGRAEERKRCVAWFQSDDSHWMSRICNGSPCPYEYANKEADERLALAKE